MQRLEMRLSCSITSTLPNVCAVYNTYVVCPVFYCNTRRLETRLSREKYWDQTAYNTSLDAC